MGSILRRDPLMGKKLEHEYPGSTNSISEIVIYRFEQNEPIRYWFVADRV